MESRGLPVIRYADDIVISAKMVRVSEMQTPAVHLETMEGAKSEL